MPNKLRNTSGELAVRMNTPCLQGSTSVMAARDLMEAQDVDIIGVACKEDFVGTFSRSDFKNAVLRQNLDPTETILYEVMRGDPPYVRDEQSLEETFDAMIRYQWEFMPVLSGKKLLGIISLNDLSIIRDLVDSYKSEAFEKEAALSYIHSGESYAIAHYGVQEQKDL